MIVAIFICMVFFTVAGGSVAALLLDLPKQWKLLDEGANKRKSSRRYSSKRRSGRRSSRKNEETVVRELGPLEKQMVRFGRKYSGSQKAAMVVTLNKRVDMEALRSAVVCLQRRHPFARSTLSKDWSSIVDPGPFYFDSDVLRVSEHARSSASSWESIWQDVMGTPVTREVSPFSVDVINGRDSADILVAVDHYGGDGASLMLFIHELFQCMSMGPTAFSQSHESLRLLPTSTELINQYHMPTLGDQLRAVGAFLWKTVMAFPTMRKISKTNSGSSRPALKKSRSLTSRPAIIDAKTMKELAKAGKAHSGATVNVLLTSATMRVLAERLDSKQFYKQVPTVVQCNAALNLRGRIAGGKAVTSQDMGYYAGGGALVNTSFDTSVSSWDRVEQLRDQYKKEFQDENVYGAELANGFLMSVLPNEHLGFTATLSNWGRTPFPVEGYEGVGRVTFAKPLFNGNVFGFPYIAYMSNAGELEMSVVCSDRYFKQQDVDSMADSIKAEITNMVQAC